MSANLKVRKLSLLVYGFICLLLLCWLIILLFLLTGHATSSGVDNPSLGMEGIGKSNVDHQNVPSEPHLDVPHVLFYIKLEGTDSEGNDLFKVEGASLARLKSICSAMEDCVGFNSNGWMKAHVVEKETSSIDLYLKQTVATGPPDAGRRSVRDRQAGVFADHLTEYTHMEEELRIYVYETDVDKQYPLSRGHTPEVEDTFMHLLAQSKFRTKIPNEATFFLLPSRCTAYCNSVQSIPRGIDRAALITRDLLQQIKQDFPFWNLTLGTDHFYICTHSMGTEVVRLADLELWKNAIGLVNAECSERFFVPHKDISVPLNPSRRPDWSTLGHGMVNLDPQKRSSLALMVYHTHRGPVQSFIYQHFGQDTDFKLVEGDYKGKPYLKEKTYIRLLMTSKFCLCPHGNNGWSLDVLDALWFGCVPVFLADRYQPPLSGLIHWDDISVAVPEHQVGSLKKILQNISDHKLVNMQGNISRVYDHLTWYDPPRPYDAFHGILFQLWQRRHIRRTNPYPLPDIINS